MGIAQRIRWRVDIDKTTPQTVYRSDVYQGNANANTFELLLYRDGVEVSAEDYEASGMFTRSDGNRVPCNGSVTGNLVSVTLDPHCYRYDGPFMLDINLSRDKDNTDRTMARIRGTVQTTGDGPIVDTGEVLIDLESVIALVGEMRKVKADAEQAAAEARDAAQTATEAAESVDQKVEEATQELTEQISETNILAMLLSDEIQNTNQHYVFDGSGVITSVLHERGGEAIRLDEYSFAEAEITEKRTLNTGESLIITTNTKTLETAVNYAKS